MTSLIPVSDTVLLLVILGILAIAGILIAAVYWRVRRVRLPSTRRTTGPSAPGPDRFGYQPEARAVPLVTPRTAALPAPEITPVPEETGVTGGTSDITQSLGALASKYSLDRFTIATSDGLLFASSGGDDAGADAARCSGIFRNDPFSETPGVVIFGFSHKGSELVGIIRADRPVSEETRKKIERDAHEIIHRWI